MTEGQMFLDRDEAARVAGVKLDTIRRAIAKGDLRAKRTSTKTLEDGTTVPTGKYLISRDALRAWFDGLTDA